MGKNKKKRNIDRFDYNNGSIVYTHELDPYGYSTIWYLGEHGSALLYHSKLLSKEEAFEIIYNHRESELNIKIGDNMKREIEAVMFALRETDMKYKNTLCENDVFILSDIETERISILKNVYSPTISTPTLGWKYRNKRVFEFNVAKYFEEKYAEYMSREI